MGPSRPAPLFGSSLTEKLQNAPNKTLTGIAESYEKNMGGNTSTVDFHVFSLGFLHFEQRQECMDIAS